MKHFLIIINIIHVVIVNSIMCHSFMMLNVFVHFENEHMFSHTMLQNEAHENK